MMSFNHRHYVPCIRWKQGEYQALHNLSNQTKKSITPLIEVPEIGFDFETRRPAKSIDEHLAPFAERVRKKWGTRSCFVDTRLIEPAKRMAHRQHPLTFIFDALRAEKCRAIPLTGLDRDDELQNAVREVIKKDKLGMCVRLDIEEAAKPNLTTLIGSLLKKVSLKMTECDLVVDLGAPNFEPLSGFTNLIVNQIVRNIPSLSRWRTFTLCGTSFVSTMAELKLGQNTLPRFEWQLFTRVAKSLGAAGFRLPTFGDYAISHPDVLSLDMRLVKPSATIRYTADESWFIVKGPNVRDNGYTQYRAHCLTVINSPYYLGPTFSYGDQYIEDCASGSAGTGNLTTWRTVGTNHHLEKVVVDISNWFGS